MDIFFFFPPILFDNRTRVKLYTCFAAMACVCSDTIQKKPELSVKFLPASVLPVIMSEYYFNSLVQGELASAR